jgi:hypothetical protein
MGTSGNGRSNGSSRCFRRRGLFLHRQSAAISHRLIPSVSKPLDSSSERRLMGQRPAASDDHHPASLFQTDHLVALRVGSWQSLVGTHARNPSRKTKTTHSLQNIIQRMIGHNEATMHVHGFLPAHPVALFGCPIDFTTASRRPFAA